MSPRARAFVRELFQLPELNEYFPPTLPEKVGQLFDKHAQEVENAAAGSALREP